MADTDRVAAFVVRNIYSGLLVPRGTTPTKAVPMIFRSVEAANSWIETDGNPWDFRVEEAESNG